MHTNDIFQRMAESYDTPERVGMAKLVATELRNAINMAEDSTGQPSKTAMDYGCGTGLVGLELMDMFASMLFVDASQNMIGFLQAKLETAGIDNASTLCADFTQPEGIQTAQGLQQVDYILVSLVLLHIRDTPLILKQLFGLLKEGGHLLIVDFDRNEQIESDLVHNGFDQAELMALVHQTGFGYADAHTFHHGEAIFMKKDASMFIMDAVK